MHPRRSVQSVPRWVALALGSLTGLAGCVDRVLYPRSCGDGHVVAGEACFGDDVDRYDVPFTPVALRVAEFDGDGNLDVLVLGVDTERGVVAAMGLGTGDGTLAPFRDAGVTGCSAHPALGPADGDDATDLLVAGCDTAMSIYLADRAGSFTGPNIVEVGVATRTSAIVDVDRDGVADVVALGTVGDRVELAWARGRGPGQFEPPLSTVIGTVGAPLEPTSFSIGRLDGDGFDDALLAHAEDGSVLLSRGGPGGFASAERVDELPDAQGVAVLDLDGRGQHELLVVRAAPPRLEAWRGQLGGLQALRSTDIGEVAGQVISAGDVDGDARLDLAFFAADDTRVRLWLGDGRGRFAATSEVELETAIAQLAIADLDGDGAAELVVGAFADGELRIVRGDP